MKRMLSGELVRLRELRRGDLGTIVEHYNDPEVIRFLAFWTAPYGEHDANAFFDAQMQLPPETRVMAIARCDDDAFVGTIGFHRVNWRVRSGSIGVAIWAPEGRDRGYGTEAMRLLCRWAFDTLNLNRLELSVWAYNERAARVYEKVGFVHEGRRREAWYWEGEYSDVLDMGLLRADFDKIRD